MRHPIDEVVPNQDYASYIPQNNGTEANELGNSHEMGYNDNMYTRVEDLGQFWLWDAGNFNF